MVAKEWLNARWGLLLGALAFVVLVVFVPRSYEEVRAGVASDIRHMERELEGPIRVGPNEGPAKAENVERWMREDLVEMKEPGYLAKSAGWELEEVQRVANYVILIPLAGLLGVALVSPEAWQGSIYLLLSKPLGRHRMLLTKYAVCAACLLAVVLVGAVGIVLSGLARDYPAEAIPSGRIFGAAALMWMGSLFVLGVSLLASTIFRNVLLTILAAAGTVYLFHTGPDLVRAIVEMFFWTEPSYTRPWREIDAWYDAIERWRISNYWGGFYPFAATRTTMPRSFLVCLLTAVPPLLLALWVFRRKAY